LDALTADAPLFPAPPARLRSDTHTQRAFLPRVRRTVAELRRGERLGAVDRPRIEARLSTLAGRLAASRYYRDALASRGLSPRDLRRLDDLPHFPGLDRAALAEHWQDLAAPRSDEEADLVVVRSSGTTGAPVPVPRDRYDCLHMWAVLRFWTRSLGIRLPRRPRVALLDALPAGLEYEADLPLLSDGRLARIALVRQRPLARLQAFAPHVVFSDPGGLHWLQAQAEQPRPRLLLTSALPFSSAQRAALSAVVPAPVVNYYATTETGPIAWECPLSTGRFHVLTPEVWVEVEAGEVLVTRLRDSALPLLRYRTGDRARLVEGVCDCGRRGWSLLELAGRRACLFVRPDGVPVDAWGLAWLFKQVPLHGFRLVQTGPRAFRLELTPAAAGSPAARLALDELLPRLRRTLSLQGFDEPQVELTPADPASPGLKPEPFACEWPATAS